MDGLYFGDSRTFRRLQMPFSGVCFKMVVYIAIEHTPSIIGTSKLTEVRKYRRTIYIRLGQILT
jgi:hypothetical protein